jgi:hypothetical protein
MIPASIVKGTRNALRISLPIRQGAGARGPWVFRGQTHSLQP